MPNRRLRDVAAHLRVAPTPSAAGKAPAAAAAAAVAAPPSHEEFDAVVVGAGFAGMYMLHRLRTMGLRCRVLEAGAGVGGTWYWNRYPGARCDVPSMEYSFSFDEDLQQDWDWTEVMAGQPEILRYANHIADRFGLRSDVQLNTRVTAAHYDEGSGRWRVAAVDASRDEGSAPSMQLSAQFVVMATGCLSKPNTPKIAGASDFGGAVYHTGRWPHEGVNFEGLRVGLIGTGSSGIQSIPEIAKQAAHLTVFQRTPNYTMPAGNRPLSTEYRAKVKAGEHGLLA
jgi:cyclohexanone monooxygenase